MVTGFLLYLLCLHCVTRAEVVELQRNLDIAVTGCNGTLPVWVNSLEGNADRRILLEEGGNHTVTIGNSKQVSTMKCTVRVYGATESQFDYDTVRIDASGETLPLRWVFDQGLITVHDLTTQTNW